MKAVCCCFSFFTYDYKSCISRDLYNKVSCFYYLDVDFLPPKIVRHRENQPLLGGECFFFTFIVIYFSENSPS